MGEAGIVLTGRRYRRARRLDRGKRGVVAVVGTLLALLVFFALFGIFLTQYVPLWMTDNERQFADGMESSFALLKSAVDEQYSLGGPATYATPFTLASQAVPLLSQPTQATLTFIPANCPAGFFPANGTPEQPNNCIFQHVLMVSEPRPTRSRTIRSTRPVPSPCSRGRCRTGTTPRSTTTSRTTRCS